MRRNKGFTLVELLVVMAIIAILAAIAVPNVQKWIQRGRATQAIAEISNIELSITKLLSDAGRSSLNDLFDTQVLEDNFGTYDTWDADIFNDVVKVYTDATTALLRVGRGALNSPENVESTVTAGRFLMREDVVRNLGTSYISELAFDPWGNLYQIFPGHWPSRYGLNVFRVYLPPVAGAPRLPGDPAGPVEDELTLVSGVGIELIDPDTGDELEMIGVPASNLKEVYIWSNGANLVSGQARYIAPDPLNPTVIPYPPSDVTNYETGQDPESMGGGDDINNWDKDQTFMRFYN